jgi:Zn-finger protein
MGGFGSGRHGGKRTTGDMWALDIRKVQRAGRLTPGQLFGWQWSRNGEPMANINILTDTDQVTLDYRTRDRGGEWQNMNYPVQISWTPCNYGGQRAWWCCPAVGCGRRVAVLYGGKVYACRHCHKLAYRTQREQAYDRASSKADKLRDRLKWEAGILNGNGIKPKGMHWATFARLEARHDALVNQSLAGVMARFGPLPKLVER